MGPVVVHIPSYDQDRDSGMFAAEVISRDLRWHAVDIGTNNQQIGLHLIQAIRSRRPGRLPLPPDNLRSQAHREELPA